MPKLSLPVPDKLKKNGFWISIGVLALVMTVIWFLATSSVASDREANIKKVDGFKSTIAGISPTTNDIENKKLSDANRSRKAKQTATWKQSYDRQIKELTWPTRETDTMGKVVRLGLPQEFIDAVTKLPPPERLRKPPLDDLRPDHKEIYKNFAKSQIKDLCDIINASYRIEGEKKGAAAAAAATKDKGDDKAQPGEIVVWPQGSQLDAQDLLTFADGGNPTTQEILYSQENLWVYQTLLKIIKRTNDSLKETKTDIAHYNAPVKIIHDILIGSKYAPPTPGALVGLEKVTDAPKDETARAEGQDGENAEEPQPTPMMLLLAGKRYVDANGQPIKGAALNALGTTASFKRMPIYMKLEIDQRQLGRLLVECANSPLTVEVKQVSFSTTGHFERVAAATPKEATQPGQPADKGESKPNFYDLTVEIHGHIYIFYPPTAEKADEPATEDGEQPADGTEPPPAKTPEAATPNAAKPDAAAPDAATPDAANPDAAAPDAATPATKPAAGG